MGSNLESAGRRALPSVQKVMEAEALRGVAATAGNVKQAVRTVLDTARARLTAEPDGPVPGADALGRDALAVLAGSKPRRLARVINATGIVLHTNLGRAPLAAEALAAIVGGYSALEFDLATGMRGRRGGGAEALLTGLTGAEAALIVNNNAAAVLLALTGLAAGAEVIVSRGELIEIGGGFRIPDVIRQGGARLVEIGTTNRTYIEDYARAITPETKVILKVHPSNYRVAGFTAAADLPALSALARAHGLHLVEDLGSGALAAIGAEKPVAASIAAGADLVTLSGDKLLGGPQAGILVGREAVISILRRHPLMRAVRIDKLSLAALEATLELHRQGAGERIPVLRMLGQKPAALEARARRLSAAVAALPGVTALVEPSTGYAGGGSLPEEAIPSSAVAVSCPGIGEEMLAARLRLAATPVIGRIAGNRVILDMLTVAEEEVAEIAAALAAAAGG